MQELRIESGTRLEIVHRRFGRFTVKASAPFSTKDDEWPVQLEQDSLRTNKKTYHRGSTVRCMRPDVINYFFV